MEYLGISGFMLGLIFFSNPFQLGWPYSPRPNIAYADEMHTPDISIFDSRTQPGESYLIMDDCFVPLKTAKTNDLCYVQKQIQKQCDIFYELEKNCGKK